MSRSRKKTPISKSSGIRARRFNKRDANGRVRRTRDVVSGKMYRRITNPWDIYDHVIYYPKSERLFDWDEEHAIHNKSRWFMEKYGDNKPLYMKNWAKHWLWK